MNLDLLLFKNPERMDQAELSRLNASAMIHKVQEQSKN